MRKLYVILVVVMILLAFEIGLYAAGKSYDSKQMQANKEAEEYVSNVQEVVEENDTIFASAEESITGVQETTAESTESVQTEEETIGDTLESTVDSGLIQQEKPMPGAVPWDEFPGRETQVNGEYRGITITWFTKEFVDSDPDFKLALDYMADRNFTGVASRSPLNLELEPMAGLIASQLVYDHLGEEGYYYEFYSDETSDAYEIIVRDGEILIDSYSMY